MRSALLIFLSIPLFAADSALDYSRTLGGTDGASSAIDVRTDKTGNVYVLGSTNAFDFPVTDGSRNRGVEISTSTDSGATWNPVRNLPAGLANAIAIDPSGALYSGGDQGVFRSTDQGKTWLPTAPILFNDPICNPYCAFNAITPDPTKAGVIYAAGSLGIFKTIDAGATWRKIVQGYTPPISGIVTPVTYFVVDPFHPNIVHVGVGAGDFISLNGGDSWTQSFVPTGINDGVSRVAFDPHISGLAYHSGPGGTYVSTDSGQTWRLSSFTDFSFGITASLSQAGVAYAFDSGGRFFKSIDSGANWSVVSSPRLGTTSMVIDPFNPLHFYASGSESLDGGVTWTAATFGRAVNQVLFGPNTRGLVYAVAPVTPDLFIAKFGPTGRNLLFARYFGGPGVERPVSLRLDTEGNIYVFGYAFNGGIPLTPGAAVTTPATDATPQFLAKFNSDGQLLYSTYTQTANLMAASPDGTAVVTSSSCLVQKFSRDGTAILWSKQITKSGTSCYTIAVNDAGEILVGGDTGVNNVPVTSDALQPKLKGSSDAFFVKLDSDGNIIYATYLGGPQPPNSHYDFAGDSRITNAAFDAKGNILLTGSTAAVFPTTPGAYQSALNANCPYPSSSVATGFIGTITQYRMDDVFVTKLDPTGRTILASTLIGGACFDQASSIDSGPEGNLWITGWTDSNPFPQMAPFASGPAAQQYTGFVSEFDGAAQSLLLSSYLTGAAVLASDRTGGVWIAGSSGNAALLEHVGAPSDNPMKIKSAGNAFTGRNGPISPGEFAIITLDRFHPDQQVNLGWNVPLPLTLSGVQVFFDGEPAALISVEDGRIECLTPYDLSGKQSTVIEVLYRDQVSTSLTADVKELDPGLLSLDGSGLGQANARNSDGTLNTPQNPADRGSTVTFYLTGFGVGDQACPYGQIAPAGLTVPLSPYSNMGSVSITSLDGFICGIGQFQLTAPTSGAQTSWPIILNIPDPKNGFFQTQTLQFFVK